LCYVIAALLGTFLRLQLPFDSSCAAGGIGCYDMIHDWACEMHARNTILYLLRPEGFSMNEKQPCRLDSTSLGSGAGAGAMALSLGGGPVKA
jgi:hypothetical protein